MIIPPRGEWSVCQQFTCSIEGEAIEPRWLCGQPVERAKPAERMAQWRRSVPNLDTDHEGLRMVVARSAEDLGALRIFDPDFPERTVVAAGAPWFMTLFGRDSLITSWMALLVDPELALGVLQTLARFQGAKVDPRTEEEPGRILHEMRFGDAPSLSLGGGKVYYGTADATPLFVMLLGELRRWGLAKEAVDQLLPHADRAIEWIENYGDRDGDGYVEYLRTSDRGLANQGWKDSHDGVRFADGRIAQAPIALCEVQGYVYGAYLARAYFAGEQGDHELQSDLRRRAAKLKTQFNKDFWLEDKGWLAMGLDKDKRPIDALTSNMGHCLWTGILDADKATLVAKRLLSHDMFTGWGVRTLAASMKGYNPISYHCGSVWPHDNAIVAAGLMRYGFVREAQRVIMGMLDAAVLQGGRLPELFSGLDRLEMPTIVAYPTSCSPQAWAAASPLLMLRSLLRLDPWVPRGKVWLHPALPEQFGRLRVDRIPLAGARVSVSIDGDKVEVTGLPADLELVDAPRHPLDRLARAGGGAGGSKTAVNDRGGPLPGLRNWSWRRPLAGGNVAGAVGKEAEGELPMQVGRLRWPGAPSVEAWLARPRPARLRSHVPMRRLYSASGPPMSSPSVRRASGASTQARAGMLRSRRGVGGRSSGWRRRAVGRRGGGYREGPSPVRTLSHGLPGRAHQPRSTHSCRWGSSAPMVVSSPWPGKHQR